MSEEEKLCAVVDEFAAVMKRRLVSKMAKGYRGWDAPNCRDGILLDATKDMNKILQGDHVQKHCIDVANRLMMVWYNEVLNG